MGAIRKLRNKKAMVSTISVMDLKEDILISLRCTS
jgi:hypothetical protein